MQLTTAKCLICKQKFTFYGLNYKKGRKYCSVKCYGESRKKYKICPTCKIVFAKWQNKKFCSKACVGIQATGKNNWLWKGNKVGYSALHTWVRKHFGSPMQCEKCRNHFENRQSINWANISGEYKREKKDWIRLCNKCHKEFDKTKQYNVDINERVGFHTLSSYPKKSRKKSHCIRGHLKNKENCYPAYYRKNELGTCKICAKLRNKQKNHPLALRSL